MKLYENSVTVCICDEKGIHYPCPNCGKQYNNDLDALMCCILDYEDKKVDKTYEKS